jgi:hypothetical protein
MRFNVVCYSRTSNACPLQVVDLTARGSRKGGLTSRPTPSGARVERIDLLSEAHAYLRSDSEPGFKGSGGSSSGFRGLGGSSANPWTVPEEIPELSAKQKEAELEAAAKRRMEALAQELKKAERLLNTQVGCGKVGLLWSLSRSFGLFLARKHMLLQPNLTWRSLPHLGWIE